MNSRLRVPAAFEIGWRLDLQIGLRAATLGSGDTGVTVGVCVFVCVEGVGFLWFGCVDHFVVP